MKLMVPYGFTEACKNCNPGYTTKEVCGKYYNPACELTLNSSDNKMKIEANTKGGDPKSVTQQKGDSTKIIKNLPKPITSKVNVFQLKKGETIKIEVPDDGVVIVKSKVENGDSISQ